MKTLAAGFLAAIALISTASAQTKIYITGSSAFRKATTEAIGGSAGTGGGGVLSGTFTAASDNSDLTSANAVTWTGGNIGGTAVTIKVSWSGSAAGIQTVAGSLNVRFLPDGATGTSNADPRQTANPAEVAVPDMCLADNQQTSTPFRNTFNSVTYLNLTAAQVGVVSFTYAASNGFPSGLSMTKKAFEYQFAGLGYVPLSTYNGSAADAAATARFVYAIGRDPDSGTRITALAEAGYGVSNAVRQFKPTAASGSISALGDYPDTTVNGITYAGSNMGESSGSSLRAFLNNTVASSAYKNGETGPSYVVTYLGISDFLKVVTAAGYSVTDSFGTLAGSSATTLPAVPLAWNGVSFNRDNIVNGSYTFWGYEYVMNRSTLGNGTTGGPAIKLTCKTNLVTKITGTTTANLGGNVKLTDMQVSRSGDGGPITNLNL